MAEVVGRYDLISFDHPFCGTIAAGQLFVALNEYLPDQLQPANACRYAGPSLISYRYGSATLGAPIDAACQHGIYRADLLEALGEPVPATWGDTLQLGRRLARKGKYLGAAFASPHGFLTFASLCANLGAPLADDPRDRFMIDRDVAITALKALKELSQFTPRDALTWDSIALHDAMSSSNDMVYCPCEFGYATYGEGDSSCRLSFSDFAGLQAPFHAGAILGGVGLGVPTASRHREQALRFVDYVLQPGTQTQCFAGHHGQPALMCVWEDADVNDRFNGFFFGVRNTIAAAAIRPRFPGFIHTQFAAGRLVERFIAGQCDAVTAVHALIDLFASDRAKLETAVR
jgi:multiple sugar transport system substrate-binding protein